MGRDVSGTGLSDPCVDRGVVNDRIEWSFLCWLFEN